MGDKSDKSDKSDVSDVSYDEGVTFVTYVTFRAAAAEPLPQAATSPISPSIRTTPRFVSGHRIVFAGGPGLALHYLLAYFY